MNMAICVLMKTKCKFNYLFNYYKFVIGYTLFRGMKVTSGIVTINKDPTTNLIGITIGGGPPHCPCIYVIQVKKLVQKL